MVNKQSGPYFDDYSPAKNYIQLLAQPGRVEQAREFTQIQTMFLDFLNRGLGVFLRNGDIIEGGIVTVERREDLPTLAHISKSQVYVDGIVHTVEAGAVEITAIGRETIGVAIIDTVVTYTTDPTLLDPALGQENYQEPGADRLRRELRFTANNPEAIPCYELEDGVILNSTNKPEMAALTEVMARRTFDESGNYRISGFEMYSEEARDTNDVAIPDKVAIKINPGKAYVRGFEVIKAVTSTVNVDKSLETRTVLAEEYTFQANKNLYPLTNLPVKTNSQVTKVVATVQVTEQEMTKGSPSSIDYPRFTSEQIVDILQVKAGGQVYVKGVDFQLSNNGIDWSLSGSEPATGALYYATYQYKRAMVKGADYLLTERGEVDFSPNGVNPVVGKPVTVDYEFYLSRIDVISVNNNGEFNVTRGQPELQRLVQAPRVDPHSSLPLAAITLAPSSEQVSIRDISINRVSMQDIGDIVKRVENMEFNIAVQELENETLQNEPTTGLKGIFSEGFISLGRSDLDHPDYSTAFDLERGEMVHPATSSLEILRTDLARTSAWTTPGVNSDGQPTGKIAMVPFTEELSIEQIYATVTMPVNPYQVFEKIANARLIPDTDNWVDETRIEVEKNRTVTQMVDQWWGDPTQVTTTRQSRVVLDEAVTFMRTRRVDVVGRGYVPNSDNIVCTFDGQKVSLTPTEGTPSGTEAGTLKAKADGSCNGFFQVPANVRTGTKEVKLSNRLATATTTYTARGRRRVVEDTTTSTTTIFRERPAPEPLDPLAQSFGFSGEDRILTSVGVYFSEKDPVEPVIVQIRNMEAGVPGGLVLAEKLLNPKDVIVNPSRIDETRVTFDEPALIRQDKQYAIVIMTTSPLYAMHVAELGGTDKITGRKVASQPYSVGVLFSSSNATTWTPHQTMDLKFRIYTAKFHEGEFFLQFHKLTGKNIDQFLAIVDSMTPVNTSLEWEANVMTRQGETGWNPVTPFVLRDIGDIGTEVTLRARMRASNYASPAVSIDSPGIVGFATLPSSTFVSRMITLADPAKVLKQIVEVNLPSNSTYELAYKVRDSDEEGNPVPWTVVDAANVSIEAVGNGWTRYTVETNLPDVLTVRLRLRTRALAIPEDPMQRPIIRAKARKFMNILKLSGTAAPGTGGTPAEPEEPVEPEEPPVVLPPVTADQNVITWVGAIIE